MNEEIKQKRDGRKNSYSGPLTQKQFENILSTECVLKWVHHSVEAVVEAVGRSGDGGHRREWSRS